MPECVAVETDHATNFTTIADRMGKIGWFEFQVLRTEHFDLYFYPEEAEAADTVARMAERWHARLSRFFGHQLRGRQPVILYAASAHFRQTNAIEGLIGEGTGGVTEAIKRRVVLPMSGSLADTDRSIDSRAARANSGLGDCW